MIRRLVTFALFSLTLAVLSCAVDANDDGGTEPVGHVRDGEVCATWEECRSGNCTYHLCEGSTCRCPGGSCPEAGRPSEDCEPGWLCAHVPPHDPLGFQTEPFDQCVPPCPTCPTHWVCSPAPFCRPDGDWLESPR